MKDNAAALSPDSSFSAAIRFDSYWQRPNHSCCAEPREKLPLSTRSVDQLLSYCRRQPRGWQQAGRQAGTKLDGIFLERYAASSLRLQQERGRLICGVGWDPKERGSAFRMGRDGGGGAGGESHFRPRTVQYDISLRTLKALEVLSISTLRPRSTLNVATSRANTAVVRAHLFTPKRVPKSVFAETCCKYRRSHHIRPCKGTNRFTRRRLGGHGILLLSSRFTDHE